MVSPIIFAWLERIYCGSILVLLICCFHLLLQVSRTRDNALSAEHQLNDSDQSDSSSGDDSDQSDSSSDDDSDQSDNRAKRKTSQCLDDQMDNKKLKADNP